MKLYKANTVLPFGAHEGKTIKEVVKLGCALTNVNGTKLKIVTVATTRYLDWCVKNIDDFYIDMNTITELREIDPLFFTDKDTLNVLMEKTRKIIR